MSRAGTSARVYISLVGDANKTEFMRLKSTQSSSGPFTVGQEDIFQFGGPFVGKLEKAKLLLESKDEKTSWYLRNLSITINEISLRYLFTVEKWLSINKQEKMMEFVIYPNSVERLFRAVPYEITFYTESEPNSGTDALVYLQLYGNKGARKTEMLLFESDGRFFAAGGTDTFNVYTSEVGNITKIRVGHNGRGSSAIWQLKKIRIRKLATHICNHCHLEVCPNMRISNKSVAKNTRLCENGRCDCYMETNKKSEEMPLLSLQNRPLEEYWFFGNRWLPPRNIANGQNFCELLPANADSTPLSDQKPTAYEIFVRTANKSGAGTTSQAYLTLIGENSDSGEFILPKAKDLALAEAALKVEAIGLGKINKIRMRHDNTGTSPDWHLRDVTVIECTGDSACEYLFVCNSSLTASADGSGHLIQEFLTSQIKLRQGDSKTVPSKDYSNSNPTLIEKNRFLSTGSFADSSSDRAPPPKQAAAPTREVNGQKKNPPTTPQATSTASKGVYEVMNRKSALKTYRIIITTGAYVGSGTTSQVFLLLRGDKGNSGIIPLNDASYKNGVSGKKKFQSGSTDNFLISVPDIGELKDIRLGHDNSGSSPTWYVERVEVESPETGSIIEFPCNQWIGKSGEQKEAFVDLSSKNASSGTILPTIFYEFKIFTSDILNAGTDANVFATLTGAKGRQTAEVNLKGAFQQGGREILYVNLEDVGEPLQSLHIRHDNSGDNPSWHLDRVEVRPMGSKLPEDKVYKFKCNRWLSDINKTEMMLNATISQRDVSSPTREGKKATFEIAVTTGTIKNAGTTSRVYLCLIDDDGRKEERQLMPIKSSTPSFRAGQTDIFIWEDVPLKDVQKICLRHDISGTSPAWYVDKVVVSQKTQGGGHEKPLNFICNKWISGSGEEFAPMSQMPPNISAPTPSADGLMLDLPLPEEKLPPPPPASPMPSPPSDAYENPPYPLDMALPPPPPDDFNGFPQPLNLHKLGNDVHPNIPSISPETLPPMPQSDEEEVPYKISLETGKQADAGTKGPVLMNLIGPNSTSSGWLFFRTLAGDTSLPAGSYKTFVFNAPPLSEITAIEIFDQSVEQSGSGWYLKHLIIEISNNKMIYDIPCNLWVTNKKNDGRAYQRITISPDYLIKKEPIAAKGRPIQMLKLWLAGQIPENVGSNVALQIIGNYGASSDVEMVNRDWASHSRLLTLQFYTKEDVNSISRIKCQFGLNNERESDADWRITSAILEREDEILSKQYYFTEWQLVKSNEKMNRITELTSTPPAKPSVTAYKIRVKTSNVQEAGTNANVYIRLIGEAVESADIHLKDSESNPVPFEKGQIDQFTIKNLPDLGGLVACRLWHDNRMANGAWSCEWVYVTEVLPEGSYISPQSWYFPCNRWLRGDGRSQVVPIDLLPMDVKAAPTIAIQEPDVKLPVNEKENLKSAKKPTSRIEKTEYTVEVETSNAMEAGTDLTGWIIIKGRRGISPVLQLKNSDGGRTLQRGLSDKFSITCESLGLIQQVYVGLYDPNAFSRDTDDEPKYVKLQLNRQNQWNCRRILVTDGTSGETYVFNINQWILAQPEIDRRNGVAARPAELRYAEPQKKELVKDTSNANKGPTVSYKITIDTGDMENAGTTANVYITLYGKQKGATSGSRRLQRITDETFGRGRTDVFFVSCAKLGEITRIQVEHDNAGSSPDWFIKNIAVKDVSSGDTWNFPCNTWIALTQGSRALRMELRAV
ncbi:hypothetical protein Aperf_G00000044779 [Anoplocephala perfoliata]